MLKIGMLLTRNEDDIITEVMTEYEKQFDVIFALDNSDDNTFEIIKSFKNVVWAKTEKELGISATFLKDGIRQIVLSAIQDRYGYDGWIFPIHGDEIYHGSIAELLETTENKYMMVNCLIAHFVIHESEKDSIHTEDQSLSIQERRKWYFMGQCEHCGFKNQKGLYYNFFEHMRVYPHGIYPQMVANRVIIRKHYNLRSPKQTIQRVKDRLERGYQPAY
ncbi:MAG: glycosyltransferase family 2 protein, partial [Planctomycetota bacterium]|nr:glycosyltransferase family 2 protein [Planctomycetota bacterium]